jgi:hypothetical protein
VSDETVKPPPPDYLIDLWFDLRKEMFFKAEGANAEGLRPPSLRDAAYNYAASILMVTPLDPHMMEAFVNGLEIGAMAQIKELWDKRNK